MCYSGSGHGKKWKEGGKLYEKKTIGDAIRKIKPDDIILANRMLYVAATISVILFAVIRILLQLI